VSVMSAPGTTTTIRHKWRDLRFRRCLLWMVALTYVPGVLSVALLSQATGVSEDDLFIWITFAWLACFIAAGVYLLDYRCPRCGNLFVRPPLLDMGLPRSSPLPETASWSKRGWSIKILFARRCSYCSFGKGDSGRVPLIPRTGRVAATSAQFRAARSRAQKPNQTSP
jgi:hypothetical protein